MGKTPKNISPIKVETMKTRLSKMVNAASAYAKNLEDIHVYISTGNSKTGFAVPSVSLIPVKDCGNCAVCGRLCYDLRNDLWRPSVQNTRANNSALAHSAIDRYFFEIKLACKAFRFFRWHVGGDILSAAYLAGMVDVALACPHCTFLAFTKMYGLINDYIQGGGVIPSNMQIIFSAWPGAEMVNPYNFPTSSPRFADGSCAAPEGAQECPGNCSECAVMGSGCWTLRAGEGIVFNAH